MSILHVTYCSSYYKWNTEVSNKHSHVMCKMSRVDWWNLSPGMNTITCHSNCVFITRYDARCDCQQKWWKSISAPLCTHYWPNIWKSSLQDFTFLNFYVPYYETLHFSKQIIQNLYFSKLIINNSEEIYAKILLPDWQFYLPHAAGQAMGHFKSWSGSFWCTERQEYKSLTFFTGPAWNITVDEIVVLPVRNV